MTQIRNQVGLSSFLLFYAIRFYAIIFLIPKQVRGAMEIAVFIQNIQEERAEVALYIFSNQTSAQINETVHQTGNKKSLEDRFQQTDRALEEVPTWPDVMH